MRLLPAGDWNHSLAPAEAERRRTKNEGDRRRAAHKQAAGVFFFGLENALAKKNTCCDEAQRVTQSLQAKTTPARSDAEG